MLHFPPLHPMMTCLSSVFQLAILCSVLYTVYQVYSVNISWIEMPSVTLFDAAQHSSFIDHMLSAYRDMGSLNAAADLKSVAIHTQGTLRAIDKSLMVITETRMDDEAYEIERRAREVLTYIGDMCSKSHGVTVVSRAMFLSLMETVQEILDDYMDGNTDGLAARLTRVDEEIVELQKQYEELQYMAHQAVQDANSLVNTTTRLAIRVEKKATSNFFSAKSIAASSMFGAAVMMLTGGAAAALGGGAAGGLMAMGGRLVEQSAGDALLVDSKRLLALALDFEHLSVGLQKYNTTLTSLRTKIRETRPLVTNMKKALYVSRLQVETARFRDKISEIVDDHDRILREWHESILGVE